MVPEGFPAGSQNQLARIRFRILELNGVQIEVVNADETAATLRFLKKTDVVVGGIDDSFAVRLQTSGAF